jgi:hypothetical protein
MIFDERSVPLLHQANLLTIANIVCRGMPVFNAMTITVMVDRWQKSAHEGQVATSNSRLTYDNPLVFM